MEEEILDVRKYVSVIKSKWKIIASITAVFAIVSGLVSFFVLDPVYKADITIMVKTEKASESEFISQEQINVSQKLAITYGEIIKSRTVLGDVIANLNLEEDYQELLENISVSNVSETQIIKISVKNTDRKKVARIANEIPKVFTREAIRIADANGVEVIDYAIVPTKPIKPNKLLNILIATVVGMAIGLVIVLLQELLNNKLKSLEDVEKKLELPVLGAISFDKNKSDKKRLVCLYDEKSPIAEQYRAIRTNLEFANLDDELKVICLTSSIQNEGKSTVISNLAIAFEKLEKKVLLIDADLRNPSIHKIFNIMSMGGLTDILRHKKPFEECVTKVGDLDILIAGSMPPNPSEVLSSKKMMNFINEIKEQYDYIFIDTPPIGIVTDAGIVSKYTDAVLFVSAYDQVDVSTAKLAKDKLNAVGANLIGVIFNKFKSSDSIYNYYYYGDDEKKKKKKRRRKEK